MNEKFIIVKGARENNLKNIDLKIPRDKFIVFTGLSGSGKSTLAFDTIFAEGQRKYLESLSSYARQFLGQMDKPDVDYIHGLSPAISIDQKSAGHNPRSTVGTVTEIHDYLRLLYAKIGIPHCPDCGRKITSITTEEIVEEILSANENEEIEIIAPLVRDRKGSYDTLLEETFKKGFSYAYVNGKKTTLSDWKNIQLPRYKKHTIDVLVDKIKINADNISRIFEAVENALSLSDGLAKTKKEKTEIIFSRKLSCPFHKISFPPLEPRLFSFNSPQGACNECEGLGQKKELDIDMIMPDKNKTIEEGGLLPWNYKRNNFYGQLLKAVCQKFSLPLNTRLKDFSKEDLDILLYGANEDYDDEVTVRYYFKSSSGYYNLKWEGLLKFLTKRYKQTQSETIRKEIEKYMSVKPCPVCQGARYRKEVLLVEVGGKNIAELSAMSIQKAHNFIEKLSLSEKEKLITERINQEILARLSFLINVGLDYLTLSRSANTLSGGEAQRIRLASQIGSGLVGVLYILDEPSIGLHAKDNARLLEMLLKLKNLGNTVIVIEHDEETIRAGEFIVDIGPKAGNLGGKIVHSGNLKELLENKNSITAKYLRGEKTIPLPTQRRSVKKKNFITIRGAHHHNLKNISTEIPTGVFVCVTGVSGSGKSTLVEEVLYKNLSNKINRSMLVAGKVKEILGYENIRKVTMIDQSPIGRTPRSNPATYTGVFTPIRKLFALSPQSKARGYQMGRFSFNIPGGRCENCKGDGFLKIEMQFMPDVYLPCDVCKGKRYGSETLKIKYKGKNIADVLDMTVSEAEEFFKNFSDIHSKIKTLKEVGLGYIKLGQSAVTLSGGEAQRIKLSSELSRRNNGETLYILDEPTTGLHFDDVKKLLSVLHRLVDAGNSVVVIEHNMDVIKTADWIVDMGPEGGDGGGKIVVSGPPEEIIKYHQESHTAKYLKGYLKGA